jgi:glutamyl-tRNA synthetase
MNGILTKIQITLMDWGNAFVRSKIVDANGIVTAIEMDLNLDGDFRKTKKKITWLAQPTAEQSLVDVTLLDYDYLITKKKLEENDELKDFVSPVTEFRSEAYADANVKGLKKGDIIQFERKGYYIFDGATGEGAAQRLEFIRIPDGKQASLASKHVQSETPTPKEKPTRGEKKDKQPQPQKAAAPTITGLSMYKVDQVYGEDFNPEIEGLEMYKVNNVYEV